MKKAVVIGAGIGGLSAASVLAQAGWEVTVIEKNNKPGGRINYFQAEGFTFDMGPSWYWMPEAFENFYKKFGHTASDFYQLKRLDPSYKVFFKESIVNLPASYKGVQELFERIEQGSAKKLDEFLEEAAYKYEVGMSEFVWKPGQSVSEFIEFKVFTSIFRLQMFSSISKAVSKVVKHDVLRQILEFPILFLGATAQDTPALYSLMNFADIKLGTWYPMGGMYEIAKAFYAIAKEQNVSFKFNEPVVSFDYQNNKITAVQTDKAKYDTDVVIANADYHHIDQHVLAPEKAHYNSKYWESRKMAPSSLLVFLGVDRKLPNLEHHNLFFDADFDHHAHQIYKEPDWPEDPLFYVCCPSLTDLSVAPAGKENLFLLMPVAPNLKEKDHNNEKYLAIMLDRLEKQIGVTFRDHIVFKKFFSVSDFKETYNAFKGNAYGLANTLFQTALLKPSLKSKKISNLLYAGQLTTPGPGLPPSIISGQVAAAEVLNSFR